MAFSMAAPSSIRGRRVARRARRLVGFLAAGATYALDDQGRTAGFFGDQPILFFDGGTRRRIAVMAAEHLVRHPAIGALSAVLIDHVEQGEFSPRCRLSCHCLSPV